MRNGLNEGEMKMSNDIQTAEKNFLEDPQTLTSGIVRKYLDPQGKASDEELAYFIAQARVQNLNPFTKEIRESAGPNRGGSESFSKKS